MLARISESLIKILAKLVKLYNNVTKLLDIPTRLLEFHYESGLVHTWKAVREEENQNYS